MNPFFSFKAEYDLSNFNVLYRGHLCWIFVGNFLELWWSDLAFMEIKKFPSWPLNYFACSQKKPGRLFEDPDSNDQRKIRQVLYGERKG